MTTFQQTDRQRYLISLVNFQKDLPNIPVQGVRVRLRLGERRATRLLLLPEQEDWPYEAIQGGVEFVAPTLETLAMFALEYV